MVLLQYIVPALGILLVGVLGAMSTTNVSGVIQGAWLTFFCTFVLTVVFDRSRGRWISFLCFAVLALYTAGLYVNTPESFLSWVSCVFISVSLVVISSQLAISPLARALMVTFAGLIAFLPSALTIHFYSPDEAAYIVPVMATAISLVPFVLQYVKIFRPEIVWPIITLQQMVLRLTFATWAFMGVTQDKALSLTVEHRLVLAIVLGIMLVVTNIKQKKISWPHISLTTYTLIVIYISLFKIEAQLPLLLILIATTAHGTVYPKQVTTGNKKEKDLSLMEIGAFGSPGFLVALWLLYKAKANVETYEFVLWSIFLILITSKMWSQTNCESIFGNTRHERAKTYYYGRIAVQASIVLYFLSILINQKFNFIFV